MVKARALIAFLIVALSLGACKAARAVLHESSGFLHDSSAVASHIHVNPGEVEAALHNAQESSRIRLLFEKGLQRLSDNLRPLGSEEGENAQFAQLVLCSILDFRMTYGENPTLGDVEQFIQEQASSYGFRESPLSKASEFLSAAEAIQAGGDQRLVGAAFLSQCVG